jgi:uncharacterized protein (TIGR00255 family)
LVKSMTGYGRGEAQTERYSLLIEAKAVNHRFLEIVIRSPRQLNPLEDLIKKTIQSTLGRGRIDLFVTLEEVTEKKSQLKVDKELALAYYNSLLTIAQTCDLIVKPELRLIASFPGVISLEKEEDDLEELTDAVSTALNMALDSLIVMRSIEGQVLAHDIRTYNEQIAEIMASIAQYSQTVVEEYKVKLQARIVEILDNVEIDANKLASEVAFFADKCDISEELARMTSHQKQLLATLEEEGPSGRKLEFILQEMNREINTIGSKSNNINISKLVIDAKSGLEKIREQIQNVE